MNTPIAPLVALAAPIALALTAAAFPKRLAAARNTAAGVSLLAAGLMAAAGLLAVLGGAQLGGWGSARLVDFGSLAGLPLSLDVRLDALSFTVAGLVAGLGAVLLRYSVRYLDGDPQQIRFLRRMTATLSAVLVLVLAGDLWLLLGAWTATSLTLHGLLLHNPERPGAVLAARKKFLFSRVGEGCLAIAAILVARAYGTLEFTELFARAEAASLAGSSPAELPWIAALIAVAALIKCAQFPFHAWLPEVMETPTPVSALLHAGIINAGGFLVLRFSPLLVLEPSSLLALAVVGGFTSLFAGAVMLTQNNIKVTLAWSTCAQMGFMLLQCGLGVFSTAVLHLLAHSTYKAHSFLSSSSGVDRARRGGPRVPSLPRGPLALTISIGLALAVSLGAAFTAGLTPSTHPGKFVLSGLLGLGLAAFAVETRRARDLRWILPSALALLTAYFGLSFALSSWLGSSIASDVARFGTVAWFLSAAGMLAFAGALALPRLVRATPSGPRTAQVYAWLHSGAGVSALWDRWISRFTSLPADPDDRGFSLSGLSSPVPDAKAKQLQPEAVEAAAFRALDRFAPLWPLDRFVAVNPFLGFAGDAVESAAAELAEVRGARFALNGEAAARRLDDGRITRRDLRAAIAVSGSDVSAEGLEAYARRSDREPRARVASVADAIDAATEHRVVPLVPRELGRFLAARFDAGHAGWKQPFAEQPTFSAWRALAELDRSTELAGVRGFRKFVAQLPSDPRASLVVCLERIGVPEAALDRYLQRAAHAISGWVGMAQRIRFEARRDGRSDETVLDLLAIRVAFDAALAAAFEASRDRWWPVLAASWEVQPASKAARTDLDVTLSLAHELSTQRDWLRQIPGGGTQSLDAAQLDRPRAHAVFCIDVRSEVFRRHLEGVSRELTTGGFAGFFGLPMRFVRAGDEDGLPRCPVLLEAGLRIEEDHTNGQAKTRKLKRRQQSQWHSFKSSSVGGFAYIETLGLTHAPGLLLGSRKAPADLSEAAPEIGLSLSQRVELAEKILSALCLPRWTPRLVLLAGHGSTSQNNAHASGLDCGACGGQHGGANARTAALILDDPEVRAELERRGSPLAADTRFVAGLHNTATDAVALLDTERLRGTHEQDLRELQRDLIEAGRRTRRERAPRLGIHKPSEAQLHQSVLARTSDWSQVRPEWGLAGNAAFVAAPRARTKGLDLEGRCFLHEYDSRRDPESAILELILTAPVVVASWINLQYYGSAVDNARFGSGDKVLHNVVGETLGVVLGSGGDLRTGLSLQSVHDGRDFVHDPVRLTVVVEAAQENIDRVLANHASIGDLVRNGWIHLIAIDPATGRQDRRLRTGAWEPADRWLEDSAAKPRELASV